MVKGTSREVADVLRLAGLSVSPSLDVGAAYRAQQAKGIVKQATKAKRPKTGPVDRIMELEGEDFFKTPKLLGDIQEALKAHGYIYAVTSLSPAAVRLVRSKRLRRLKNKNGLWTYVQR